MTVTTLTFPLRHHQAKNVYLSLTRPAVLKACLPNFQFKTSSLVSRISSPFTAIFHYFFLFHPNPVQTTNGSTRGQRERNGLTSDVMKSVHSRILRIIMSTLTMNNKKRNPNETTVTAAAVPQCFSHSPQRKHELTPSNHQDQ